MFFFGLGMLIYISFNLYVLYGICNSSQDKDISQRGATLQMVIL